jgi:hypothetical protein
MGADVRPTAAKARKRPSRKQLAALVPHMVREQFRVTAIAAEGCDAIVVGNMLQVAGRSIAELRKIPYVYAAFCPATLPNSDHPPPVVRRRSMPRWLTRALWRTHLRHAHRRFGEVINEQRQALGLAPIRRSRPPATSAARRRALGFSMTRRRCPKRSSDSSRQASRRSTWASVACARRPTRAARSSSPLAPLVVAWCSREAGRISSASTTARIAS